MTGALVALGHLSDRQIDTDGWVATGAVADARGSTASDVAASLRGACDRGLCICRRTEVDGTTWRVTPIGLLALSQQQHRARHEARQHPRRRHRRS